MGSSLPGIRSRVEGGGIVARRRGVSKRDDMAIRGLGRCIARAGDCFANSLWKYVEKRGKMRAETIENEKLRQPRMKIISFDNHAWPRQS